MQSAWHVYIVRCADKSLYTGIAKDVRARLAAHNAGTGAKYTRSRLPVALAWSQRMASESKARKREIEIKSWTRAAKLRFLAERRLR